MSVRSVARLADLRMAALGLLLAVLVAGPGTANGFNILYENGTPVKWGADASWRIFSSFAGFGPEASQRAREAISDWNGVSGWFDFDPETSSSSNGFMAGSLGAGTLAVEHWAKNGTTYTYWDVTVNTDIANWWAGAGDPPQDRYDMKTVLRHELGHAAGLCHSQGSSALLMWFQIGQGERKSVDWDAQNGFRFLYDNGGTEPESQNCP